MFHLQSQWSPETHFLPVLSPFALRNRTTERTSHLAGLWIQQLYALPILYLCVMYLFENKQRLVPLTAKTDWFL